MLVTVYSRERYIYSERERNTERGNVKNLRKQKKSLFIQKRGIEKKNLRFRKRKIYILLLTIQTNIRDGRIK